MGEIHYSYVGKIIPSPYSPSPNKLILRSYSIWIACSTNINPVQLQMFKLRGGNTLQLCWSIMPFPYSQSPIKLILHSQNIWIAYGTMRISPDPDPLP